MEVRGVWLNEPSHRLDPDGNLVVGARAGTDFWRATAYGFTSDSGHALLFPFPPDSSIEVSLRADLNDLYEQAGLLVRVDESCWEKAGVEFTDGAVHLGAVVTRDTSDWSAFPVPDWSGREVTLRASRSGDAVTVRARVEAEPWAMIRLAPLSPDAVASAGPYCCAPGNAGLDVVFTWVSTGQADRGLHTPPP